MICPICGTRQRRADRCVQCHTPMTGNKKKIESEDTLLDPPLEESMTTVAQDEALVMGKSMEQEGSSVSAGVSPSQGSYPSNPMGPQTPQAASVVDPVLKEQSGKILVATTQRIEGKRIGKYFGLIHANVVVDLSDLSLPPTGHEYQNPFKQGTMQALKNLRKEAALLGANAVVATTFVFHRIETQSILLTATGTAVLLEGPK
ncbi:heavy metal-binding domain-containing protein [Nitrospira defluvii]|nr:heavy metal-binding domain-containing protein [Nitrospira defluvii]